MPSYYEQVGGEAAMEKAVQIFYRKILRDQHIKHFFTDIDMKLQIKKQKAFFTLLFGGPNLYTGKDLTTGHAHLVKRGLNDSHFNAVATHLKETLEELQLPSEITEDIMAKAEAARGAILGRI
ncbi:group I truncated hemoglobin [Pigmentibacter ruber]|uniref:group I truncated hemoglobin n=1 Tax=Pigmentibacter ruber TaxID=2683196 RepID=UPI00131AEC99|nr:group 1 truncated hemoglobin [Pigmentibacter ruber]BFD32055.1 group 1 truncated hemoglobin [Pigmentibacter ruber]